MEDFRFIGSFGNSQKRFYELKKNNSDLDALRQLLKELNKSDRENLIHEVFFCYDGDISCKSRRLQFDQLTDDLKMDVFEKTYDRHSNSLEGEIEHYFRNMYYILFYATQSGMQNPENYIRLFRSQLSHSEMALLFYHCMSRFSTKSFNNMIENMIYKRHTHG